MVAVGDKVIHVTVLACLQEPATDPYPEPDESSWHLSTLIP
jgi:hypothetical protein